MARIDLEKEGKIIKTFNIGDIDEVSYIDHFNQSLNLGVKYSSEKIVLDTITRLYSARNNLGEIERATFRQSLEKQLATGMNSHFSLDEFLKVSLDWDEGNRVIYQVLHSARISFL